MGHFGVKKTEDILADHFFWPKMRGTWRDLLLTAQHAKKLSHALILMVCTCLYLFLMHHGRIFQWTLF
jgi:hypothetical protein